MKVQGFWINNEDDKLSTVGSEEEAFSTMNTAWATEGTLIKVLTGRRLQGKTVQFRSGDELLVIGGRESILESFKSAPVDQLEFAAAKDEMLFFTARRKTHKKARALGMGSIGSLRLIANNNQKSLDKLGTLMAAHNKSYTALHIYSSKYDPEGGTALGYPPVKGAMLAQVLKQLVFSEL